MASQLYEHFRAFWRGLALSQASGALLGLCAIVLLWGGIFHSLSVERQQALVGANQNTANLARAFEEHIIRSIKAVDQTLLYARDAYAKDPAGFDIAAWSKNVQFLTDLTFQISMIDKDGFFQSSNLASTGERVNLGDREHFRVQRDSSRDELFISKPVLGRVSQKWSIQMTRKILAADGSFDGVFVVSLDPQYLSSFYNSVEIGQSGVVALTGIDGIVRARVAAGESNIGQSLGGSRLLTAFAQSPAGTFDAASSIDGVHRLYAYRGVRGYPLIVSVGIAQDELLAGYAHDLRTFPILGLVLTALLSLVMVMIQRRDAHLRDTREQLRASEARYAQKSTLLEATLENISQGLMMVDADRRVQVCNHRAIGKLGLPAELMAGHPLFDDVLRWQWEQGEFGRNGDDVEVWLREFVLSGGIADQPQRYERTRPNGQVLEIQSKPLADGGVVRTYTDITERKETERVLRAARDDSDRAVREKTEFLAMMSHEIRSPMSGLMGIIELLHNTRLEAEQSYMVELAQEQAVSLLGIVNDVLDLSKIEAGAVEVVPEATGLPELIRALVQPIALSAARKDLSLRYELADGLPDRIAVDPLRLRQILGNLMGNAVKFTGTGGRVDLLVQHSVETDTLDFSVSDTGIGMTPAVLDKLFQPFAQADASTTKNFGGTGLGLSISRRLARLLGGDIAVASEPGRGSVFTLTIPLVPAPPAAGAVEIVPPELAAHEPISGLRVLVAEDQETNRWLIKRQLERLGVDARLVEDGRQALAALRDENFDLLVTDCHMPGMDGVELTQRIRAEEGEGRLTILGLTADVTSEMRAKCFDAGMDDVLSKPINLQQLGAVLRRLKLPTIDAGSTGAADAPLFDDSTYREIFGEDAEAGAAWLGGYLTASLSAQDRLGKLIEADDRATLKSAVHTLAGASLTAGAMHLGALATAFETQTLTASPEELRRQAAGLLAAFHATRDEIRGFVGRLAAAA